MPRPMKITGRSSTITNCFVNSIIPVIEPTEKQVEEVLQILGMDHDSYCCAYCGDTATEWDHLRPIVKDKKTTGYISEIHNLIPSCGKCNQSKGNKEWETWMKSTAKLSPATRNVPDLERRIETIRAYDDRGKPTKLDFEQVVGTETWDEHWENWAKIQEQMKLAQSLAEEIKQTIAKSYQSSS